MQRKAISAIYDSSRIVLWSTRLIFSFTIRTIADKIFGENIDPIYGKIENIDIGQLVTPCHYDSLMGSHTPLGTHAVYIERGSVGWVVEKFSRLDKPGSAMQFRVLFPAGLCWVSQYFLRCVKE